MRAALDKPVWGGAGLTMDILPQQPRTDGAQALIAARPLAPRMHPRHVVPLANGIQVNIPIDTQVAFQGFVPV